MKKIIVAVDGYASCGKSTIAKALAKALGYIYVDSGAMYRAVTLFCLDNDIDILDNEAVLSRLDEISISFKNENGKNTTYLNGKNVEDAIREMRVSEYVSEVSTIPPVRRALVAMQQGMGRDSGVVMDGRDIGTVVFPNAELKLFMTASPDVRAQRRLDEMRAKGILNMDVEAVKANLLHRDHIDSTREDSPLMKADDAIVIDNTNLTEEEQFKLALELVEKAGAGASELAPTMP